MARSWGSGLSLRGGSGGGGGGALAVVNWALNASVAVPNGASWLTASIALKESVGTGVTESGGVFSLADGKWLIGWNPVGYTGAGTVADRIIGRIDVSQNSGVAWTTYSFELACITAQYKYVSGYLRFLTSASSTTRVRFGTYGDSVGAGVVLFGGADLNYGQMTFERVV